MRPSWLLIETAPKDQTAVLATHIENVIGAMHVCWRMSPGSDDYLNPRTGNPWRPTHWMPLPAMPKRQDKGGVGCGDPACEAVGKCQGHTSQGPTAKDRP